MVVNCSQIMYTCTKLPANKKRSHLMRAGVPSFAHMPSVVGRCWAESWWSLPGNWVNLTLSKVVWLQCQRRYSGKLIKFHATLYCEVLERIQKCWNNFPPKSTTPKATNRKKDSQCNKFVCDFKSLGKTFRLGKGKRYKRSENWSTPV